MVAHQAPSVHRIAQARILEWVAISFSRGYSQPRARTHISCMGRWILYCWATTPGKPEGLWWFLKCFLALSIPLPLRAFCLPLNKTNVKQDRNSEGSLSRPYSITGEADYPPLLFKVTPHSEKHASRVVLSRASDVELILVAAHLLGSVLTNLFSDAQFSQFLFTLTFEMVYISASYCFHEFPAWKQRTQNPRLSLQTAFTYSEGL